MTPAPPSLDFARLFAALPARFLIVLPDAPRYSIVTASDAYCEATGTRLADMVGRGIFEVFPEDPDNPINDGPVLLRASLNRVHASGKEDSLPMLRYDIVRPEGNEERYWTPMNSPVFDEQGRLQWIVHRVEDATEFVRSARASQAQRAQHDALEERLRGTEAELLTHARQLEQSLRQLSLREAELNAVFNQAPLFQGLIALDGTFLRGNDLAFSDATGFRREDQIGFKCWDTGWWNPSDETRVFMRDAVARAAAGESTHCLTDYFIAGGMRRSGDFLISPVRDASGKVVLVYATGRDCTEETRVQEALAESEQRYRSLVTNIAGMVYRVQARPPWHFVYVSVGVEKLCGYPPSYFVDEHHGWAEFMLAEDAERVAAELAEQAAAGRAHRVEYRIRHRDGSIRWVEGRVQPAEDSGEVFEGTVFDIDDRKRAEESVRESREHLRYTLQTVPSVLWTARPDGSLDFVSDAAYEQIGVAPATLIEHGWLALLHPDDIAAADARWKRSLVRGEPYDAHLRLRDAAGGYRSFQVRARPRRDATGTILRWYGSASDIDDIKQAQARAEEATRAKSAFLSTMSHEIRTPLNAVLGFSALLADTELGTQQRDFVNSIRASGDHLLGVINDILDYSKLESGGFALDFVPCDLRTMVESALDIVASQAATKNIELIYTLDADLPPACLADTMRLRQVLVNLLGNAVKFTHAGEVLVRVGSRPLDDGEHEFEFVVRDTGIGIPPERIDRLFRDFSQVDDSVTRRFGGSGLGLAISKRLVEAHGGTIAVHSEPGVGSEFSFRLRARAVPVPTAAAAIDLDHLRGRRALLVDDNRSNLDILSLQLRAWGIETIAIAEPERAAALIEQDEQRGGRLDLIVLDHQMPGIDGLSLARKLHARWPIPTVLLSSLGTTMEQVREAHADIAAALTKPVHRSALLETIASVIAPAARAFKPADADASPQMPPLRLLLAEDNLVNRKVALLLLRKLGFEQVDVAVDGLEALDAVRTQRYDVVLMDVQMPNLDGLDATRRIRSEIDENRQPQIVAMTANALSDDRDACLAAGMDDHVAKPIDPGALALALRLAAKRRGIAVSAQAPARKPSAREEADARARRIANQVLAGGGETGALMRGVDWAQTALGPVYTWPQSLRTALSILLTQKHPIFLWWGRELIQFYNDAYRPILGATKHPKAMGQRGRECWAEIWDVLQPMIEGVYERGESTMVERGLLCLDRNGLLEECYFSYGYSPIRDETGEVSGVFVACSENTADVLSTRRSTLLLELDERQPGDSAAWTRKQALLAAARHDLPFCLIYAVEPGREARLVGSAGLHAGSAGAPEVLRPEDGGWPVFEALRTQRAFSHTVPASVPVLPPWPEPVREALLHPLGNWGVLVAGLSPRLIVDGAYRDFLFRVAQRLQRLREVMQAR